MMVMGRSGYSDDYGDGDPLAMGRWRQAVKRAIEGKRGQAFLRELADAMDAMDVKELIAGDLVTDNGCCCAMGVVCKSRGLDVESIDPGEPEAVAGLIGIAPAMAAEIAYLNDECGSSRQTNALRWTRMRAWVSKHIGAAS